MSSEVQAKWMNSPIANSALPAIFHWQILDRLHVVVGGALDVLDPLGVRRAKVLDQPPRIWRACSLNGGTSGMPG